MDPPNDRELIVAQCCQIPELLYACQRLKELKPTSSLILVARSNSDLRYYLRLFPALFKEVWELETLEQSEARPVLFPLLAGRYTRTKLGLWAKSQRRYRLEFSGDIQPLSLVETLKSLIWTTKAHPKDFSEHLNDLPPPPLGESLLLVENASAACRRQASDYLTKLCQQSRVSCVSSGSLWHNYRRLRHTRFDGAVFFASGEPGWAGLQFLPFLLGIRRLVVFNENGDFFYFRGRAWLGFLAARFQQGISQRKPASRIAFFQTEGVVYTQEALSRLRQGQLFPEAEILLVCRRQDRCHFSDFPDERILTYPLRHRLSSFRKMAGEIKRFDPDLSVAILSGRPIFRRAKLLFFLLGGRQLWSFNAGLDFYQLKPSTLQRAWRRDEPLFSIAIATRDSESMANRVLWIQTDTVRATRQALQIASQPSVSGTSRIQLLCSEEMAPLFADDPNVAEIIAYPSNWPGRLRVLRRLCKRRPDILVASFVGRPTFRLAKIAYFLLPARGRLAFNSANDCVYVSRLGTLRFILEGWRDEQRGRWKSRSVFFSLWWGPVFRLAVKTLLFLPRFAYLVIWLTLLRLRTGYTASQEE